MKLEEVLKKLPQLNCGECGYADCMEMAEKILEGKASIEDCKVIAAGENLSIFINNKKIPVGRFVQDIIGRANLGMLSTLKKVSINPGDSIYIKIKIEEEELVLFNFS